MFHAEVSNSHLAQHRTELIELIQMYYCILCGHYTVGEILVYRAITEYHCSLHATHIMIYELLLLLLVVVLCFRCPREPQPLWCDHKATPRTHMAYTQDQAHNDCKSLYVKAKQIALCNVNSVTWMSVSTHNPCKASTSSIIVTSLWLQNKVETFAIVLFVSLQTKLSSERMIKTIPSTLIV